MATEYCRSMLRICIAQLCQNLGWNATQSSPLELLTDILERYLIDLGKISHRYSEQFGRTEPNLDDLALTFRHYGIQLGELEDYIRHVEPVAFAREVVSFPARKRNNLGFPNSRSRELLQQREDHVHNHLPYMFPGMEDEVEEETPEASSLPTPQLPQESVLPMAISPTPSDKRPLSNSAEGPPAKRPRLTSSNLPEEAGHSQYEMKSLLMNPCGVLTPTRQGKLPDARTPPTFRQSLQFKDEGSVKGRENKEDTPTRPPLSVKSGRQGDDDNKDKSYNCLEKVAPKKKMLKHYKQMTAADAVSGMPRSPKITKLARSPKPGSPLGTKSPKRKQKLKSKEKRDESGSGLPNESCLKDLLLSPKVNVDKVEKMTVKSPLTAPQKLKSESKIKHKDKKYKKSRESLDKSARPEVKQPGSVDTSLGKSESEMSSCLPFSVEEESSNSRDDSEERLVIAEGDTKVKNTKEARQARLALIDDSIDSVIRNSVAEVQKKTDTFSFSEESDVKMSPKPGKGKKKDKNKTGKDLDKPKKKEKKEKSDSQSISDSIDAVIRQSSEETDLVPAPLVTAASEVVVRDVTEPPTTLNTSSPLVVHELVTKKGSKDKSDKKQKKKTSGKKKEKEASAKDKLKDKLKVKIEKELSDIEKKPSVLDKFSAQEYSVYDFPESPPSVTSQPKRATPKSGNSPKQQLLPAIPPPPPPTPPPPPPPLPPPPLTSLLHTGAAPATTVKVELPSTIGSEQPPLKTLRIVDLKLKKKDKERSKEKEHKKEKKEKKKDKEKKKKNKDKDKEKSRDKSKSREDKHKDNKDLTGSSPAGGIVAPIKLNIKFGGGSSAATSMVITETKMTSPKPEPVSPKTPRPEPLLSPKRDVPKLVIKPIRRESLEAKAKLGAASRSPAIISPPKSPTPPPLAPPPPPPVALIPPPQQVPTPPPPLAPAPMFSPPSPLFSPSPPTPPQPKIKTPPPKSPSPPPSPPKPKTPPPSPPCAPPTPSPPPSPPIKSPLHISHSPTPPPRSPTPEKLFTPSPEPKHRTPVSSPVRKSPTPEPPSPSPPPKSPIKLEKSPPDNSPSPPRRAPSPKSSPPSSPASVRLEMDINEGSPKLKPKPKSTKQSPKGKSDTKQSPKGKSDTKQSPKGKSDTKTSPKGKRGRKPKEDKEEGKAAVRPRNKSIPTVTSETVSETPITGPIVQRTVVAETIGTFLDAEGNKVWICPACKMQDDGSPMIGCDVCDDWYHWECVDIKQEPDEPEWFCTRCEENRSKSKTPRGKGKGKKRGRKKKT